MADSFCRVCSVPVPLDEKNAARHRCDAPECIAESQRRASRIGMEAKREVFREVTLRRPKVCPACAVAKPRTLEHFSVSARGPGGEVTKLDNTCKPCRAAEKRDQYRSDPERRRKVLARAKRQREERERRLRIDPWFAACWIVKRRQWDRARAERRRTQADEPEALRGGPKLPGEPIARAIYAAAERAEGGLEAVCESVGVSSRTVYRWREDGFAEFVPVDAVLTRLGLLWWDVYDPERYPEAVSVFEGEHLAA